MNEFLFFKSQQRFNQDVDVGLDFTYDGSYQPAGDGAGFVRERVLALRQLLAGVQEGQAGLEQLDSQLDILGIALGVAVTQCRAQADRREDKRVFFSENADAYQQGADALTSMQQAVRHDDLESLLASMDTFEASVRRVEELITEEESAS